MQTHKNIRGGGHNSNPVSSILISISLASLLASMAMGQNIRLDSYSSESSPLESNSMAGSKDNPYMFGPDSSGSPSFSDSSALLYENTHFSPSPGSNNEINFYLKGDYYFSQRMVTNPSQYPINYTQVYGLYLSVSNNMGGSSVSGEQTININQSNKSPAFPSTPADPNQEATFYFGDLNAQYSAYGFYDGGYSSAIKTILNIDNVDFSFSSLQANDASGFSLSNNEFSLNQANISFGKIDARERSSGFVKTGKTDSSNLLFSLNNQSRIIFKEITGNSKVAGILRWEEYRTGSAFAFDLKQSSKIIFENIHSDTNSIGIFEDRDNISSTITPTQFQIDSTSQILFSNIQSTKMDARGIDILSSAFDLTGGGSMTFSNIASSQTASGIYLQGNQNTNFSFDQDSKKSSLIFTKISGGLAEGIYVGNGSTIGFEGNGEVEFTSIAGDKIAYGLHSESTNKINFYSFDNKAKTLFKSIEGDIASYGIYNNGNAIYDFNANSVTFESIVGGKLRGVGIYNHQGFMEISGSITFKSITNSFGGVYGIQNNGDILLADGSSLTFGSPSSGISDYKIFEGLGSTLELGNMVLSSSKDTTIGIKATDTTTMLLQANKTLNFDLKSTAKEGVAFDGGNLILSSQSQVIFNSNGGNLTSLSGNDGKILLSGTSTTNRLQPNSRLLLRSLEIANMDINNSTFVLYADKSANIDTTNGFDGRAYDENKTHTSQGGSDRIIISGSTLYTPTYNTLKIALSNFSEARTYVVLAEVDASVKDTVIFNGLAKSGDKANTKSYAGFETQTLEIERYDGADKTYYFSHLASPNQAVINSDYSKSTISATQTNFSLLSANLNSLNKRMGDLRNQVNQHGVWTRIFLGSQSYDFGLGTQDQGFYWTIQAGYDYAFALSDSTNYLGFALSYLNSNTTQDLYSLQFSKNVSNSVMTNGAELAIYNSYISDQGFYSDSILKFSYLSSELDFFNQNTSYKLDNYALTLSEEIGYAIKLGTSKEWIITPQLEVAYSYFDSTDLSQTLASGHTMQVHQNSISLLRNRAGFDWRYDFSHLSKNILASLYVGTYYVYDVLDGGRITLKTINDFQSYQALKSEGRIMLNLGTNINLYEHTSLYFDFEKSFLGKQIQTDYQVNLGVRYSFGEKIKNFIEVEETENKDVTKAPLRIEEKTQDSSKEKNKVQE